MIASGVCLLITPFLRAQAPSPSYSKQVLPILTKYCSECHNANKLKGGLNLESYQSFQQGGDHGPVAVAGKPDESRLVRLLEGKDKPAMPPKKAKQPPPEAIALIRAWVAAGAKDDLATGKITLPTIRPRGPAVPPITALAYRPDGKLLAAGGQHDVFLIDSANGAVTGKLLGFKGRITALAFGHQSSYLAVSSGEPSTTGEIRLYPLTSVGMPDAQAVRTWPAHGDFIYNLAWSPDDKILATCSYDRLVKLWNVADGRLLLTLKDHSDAVYGLAFSPDGRLLASASADRAVKIWDVATGARLFTLSEATDWLYTLAWSPSQRLAGAGVDKSIRVWEVSPTKAKLVQSVFAHEGPVTQILYAADGRTLYSSSEDRTLKAWDTSRLVERKVYPQQADAILALAVRPDGKQLAVGRYDGALVLLDEATCQVQAEPLPVKPKPPQFTKVTPAVGQRGQRLLLTLTGQNLDQATELTVSFPGVTAHLLDAGRSPTQVQAELTFPAATPAGIYSLSLKNSAGASGPLSFMVDPFPLVSEKEPNDSPTSGQSVVLPESVAGSLGRAGDVDFYRFEAKAGQEIGVQVVVEPGAKWDPILELTDQAGEILVESEDRVLGYTCPRAGTYSVGIRDREYRGAVGMLYRLHLGSIPVLTAIHPLGLQRGTEAVVHLEGVNLGPPQTIRIKASPEAAPGSRLPVLVTGPMGTALGDRSLVVGEFPEVVGETGKIGRIPVPGTANGRLVTPGASDVWQFAAKKGQTLILEVTARRIGSPLDSFLEVLDLKGQPVQRALLRGLSKTYTVFRDHDSFGSGIRIESWNDLSANDYLLVGDELVRIFDLPKNPDDDCQFFSAGGRRLGFLDTTPTHHSLGTPMYKVAIHPPGSTFPPNGLPQVPIYFRNDDGGPGYDKDSRLFFEPPADGDYLVRIRDARGQGGINFGYRLTVRPPRPSFQVNFDPKAPTVWKGGAVPITVTAERIDHFSGPIEVRLESLPPGFSAPATAIPADENSTAFALSAEPQAAKPEKLPPIKLIARALIDGQTVIREVVGGLPQPVDPGEVVITTAQAEITVAPGGQVPLLATIERRHGFKGRVPVEVRGLPHGVHVLDVGLNGILITEAETSRRFVVYVEPWVQPGTHPFVVLARHEGKGTEHATKSVLLKVMAPAR
jgi:WD40 repeat protein